jgi:hypothetical protein
MKEKSHGRKTADENLKYVSALLFVLFLFAFFLGVYISVMFGFRDAIMLCSGIVIGTVFYYMLDKVLRKKFLPHWGQYKRSKQGDAGEVEVNIALKQNLGESNLILAGVVFDDNMGDIDHVVIGKYGIIVIETKTHCGRIEYNGDDWFQDKAIGENPVKIMLGYSPSIQARSNAARLHYFIRQYYPKLSDEWVKAIVVFPRKQSEGDCIIRKNEPSHCNIFDSIDTMLEEIKKGKASIEITPNDLYQLKIKFREKTKGTRII